MDTENIRKFYQSFRAVNLALTVFGLSFVQQNNQSYGVSYKRLVYGFLISLFVLFVFYLQISGIQTSQGNIVLVILNIYMAVVGTLMAILMIATAAVKASALASILNNAEYFELFDLDAFHFVNFHTIRQCSFSLFVLTACYLSDFVANGEFSLPAAIGIMMFFFFPLYNSFCLSQLFNYHYWLQRWFWNINQVLERVLDLERKKSYFEFGIKELGKCSRQKSDTFHCESVITSDLILVRRLYHKLHTFMNELNGLYSLRHVLLLVHHCALEIIYTYWGLRHTLQDLGVSLTAILNFYKAAFMSFVSVVSMVWPCTTTGFEAKRMVHLVQDLLAEAKFGETRTELQILSLQLIHQKYQFSPHGFFKMDTKLLLSICYIEVALFLLLRFKTISTLKFLANYLQFVAIVTSYLVILLQYHMMYIALQATKNQQSLNATTVAVEL